MGNNDNRVVTWEALNSFITQNGGSPKKSSGANSLALKYGEFSEYAPMATATSSGIVISNYTGAGGGAYTSNLLVIEKDVTWFTYVRPVPTAIAVTPKSTTLDIGNAPEYPTFVLHTATVTAASDADKSVTWTISDSTKASIDQTGKVTAIAVGTVTVTATTVNGLSDTATVTIVRNDAPVIVLPTGISVATDATLNPGQTHQLTATVTPANANDKTVTWSSENTGIATVNSSGLVTAVAPGVVKIYATSNADPNVKGYATITVVAAPVTTYTISWSGNHASISGVTSPVTLNEGSTWSGTFVADNGFQIDSITYTGNNVTKSGNTVSVSNLTSNVVITVSTSAVVTPTPTHTISWSGDNITIEGGATSPVTLDEGSTWTGTFTAEEGYQIDSISTTGSTASVNGNVVTVSSLDSDITITISTSSTGGGYESRAVGVWFVEQGTYEVLGYNIDGDPVWYDGFQFLGHDTYTVYSHDIGYYGYEAGGTFSVRPKDGYYITGVTVIESEEKYGEATYDPDTSTVTVSCPPGSWGLDVRVDTRSTNTYSIVFEGDEHTLHTFGDPSTADNVINTYDGYHPGDDEVIYLVPDLDYNIDLDSISIGGDGYITATTSVGGEYMGSTYYKIEIHFIDSEDAPADGYEIFISAVTDPVEE